MLDSALWFPEQRQVKMGVGKLQNKFPVEGFRDEIRESVNAERVPSPQVSYLAVYSSM